MKRAAQAAFVLSGCFLAFFLFGVTNTGQTFLRGHIPPNATHWELDDIYMGAGLAPWVYGPAPGVLLATTGAILFARYRLKSHQITTTR